MQKMTLLEMVQNIASALETDEINSITDTTESLQIAEVIKETFYEQFNNIFIPEHQVIFKLDSVSDLTRPNYLKIPDNISKVEWLKYYDFAGGVYNGYLDYVTPEEFFALALEYHTTPNPTQTVVTDLSGVAYSVFNNRVPSYYTILDDNLVVFDSYDLSQQSTMVGNNSVGFGIKAQTFQMVDAYIPPIDGNLFPLLLAEAKSVCFVNLKQITSSKEEQRAHRQRIRMQNDQFKSRKAQTRYWHRGGNYARWK